MQSPGGSDYKLIYRHYATLYFVFCVDSSESELGILDLIQVDWPSLFFSGIWRAWYMSGNQSLSQTVSFTCSPGFCWNSGQVLWECLRAWPHLSHGQGASLKGCPNQVTWKQILGTLDPEWACDGGHGAGDQHVWNNAENRGAEQNWERGGESELFVDFQCIAMSKIRCQMNLSFLLVPFEGYYEVRHVLWSIDC